MACPNAQSMETWANYKNIDTSDHGLVMVDDRTILLASHFWSPLLELQRNRDMLEVAIWRHAIHCNIETSGTFGEPQPQRIVWKPWQAWYELDFNRIFSIRPDAQSEGPGSSWLPPGWSHGLQRLIRLLSVAGLRLRHCHTKFIKVLGVLRGQICRVANTAEVHRGILFIRMIWAVVFFRSDPTNPAIAIGASGWNHGQRKLFASKTYCK